ncbi:MAG: hypothetical protein FJ308_22870 [Planctomycetes bacterium]|nr:hypothetical protein [Planctomycetota bacterium]
MKFVTYTATPELERFPERDRFGVWCSAHKHLMLTDPDYQRRCLDFRWRIFVTTIPLVALSIALSRFEWPPLVVQLPVYLALTALYVIHILRSSFGQQQFQNEQVGKALREHVAWSLDGSKIMESLSQTFRWTSKISLFGMPLYDVYFPTQLDGKSLKQATATGIFAVGLSAKGIFAAGLIARGIVSFGVCSFGFVSVGVCSIGLLFAAGTLAVAPIAFGVLAIGIVAGGVGAFGWKVLFSVG